MTISLTLAPESEHKLASEARVQGLLPEQLAMRVLNDYLATRQPEPKHSAADLPPANGLSTANLPSANNLVALVQTWIDEANQVDESEALDDEFFKQLDEDRPAYRKLFPPELKGISW